MIHLTCDLHVLDVNLHDFTSIPDRIRYITPIITAHHLYSSTVIVQGPTRSSTRSPPPNSSLRTNQIG